MAFIMPGKIDIDACLRKEKPGTPPRLHASTPLGSGYQEAPDEEKEPAAAKPSSDMTKSLFNYEEAKSV